MKNKAVIDSFAKQRNEAAEEVGRLDVYIKAFACNKDGQELMRMEICRWYDGSAADEDFHAESANYIVHVGARSFEISDRESSCSFKGSLIPAGGSLPGRKEDRAKKERW